MDPKSKQYQQPKSVFLLIAVIDEYFSRPNSKLTYWSKTPRQVQIELIAAADENYHVMFGKAVEILRTAKTDKLVGTANRGIAWIEQEWKSVGNND